MTTDSSAYPTTDILLVRAYDQCVDQAHRIDRTVEYAHDLLSGPLDINTRLVLQAVVKSLTTPASAAAATS